MADRDPATLALIIKGHLQGIEEIEAEVMRVAGDLGPPIEASMKGFYNSIGQAHRQAERAAQQVPGLPQELGGK